MAPNPPVPNPQSPPKRRWRRLVGLLVLLAAGTVVWWNWPREDPRFCGRWACVDDLTGATTGHLEFRRNGRGRSITLNGEVWLFRWHVEGDHLTIGRSLSRKFEDQIETVAYWILKATGRSVLTVEMHLQVVEIQADLIRAHEVQMMGRDLTLRRVR